MNNKIIALLVLLVVIIGGYFLLKDSDDVDMEVETEATETLETEIVEEEELVATTTPAVTAPSVKEFVVTGSPYAYSPKIIKVKKGDTVRIVFKNSGGMHDWKLDEFKAATKVLQAGAQETIEFVADKTGSFEYYCSVGSHRAMGMVGTLTVE